MPAVGVPTLPGQPEFPRAAEQRRVSRQSPSPNPGLVGDGQAPPVLAQRPDESVATGPAEELRRAAEEWTRSEHQKTSTGSHAGQARACPDRGG